MAQGSLVTETFTHHPTTDAWHLGDREGRKLATVLSAACLPFHCFFSKLCIPIFLTFARVRGIVRMWCTFFGNFFSCCLSPHHGGFYIMGAVTQCKVPLVFLFFCFFSQPLFWALLRAKPYLCDYCFQWVAWRKKHGWNTTFWVVLRVLLITDFLLDPSQVLSHHWQGYSISDNYIIMLLLASAETTEVFKDRPRVPYTTGSEAG